MKITKSPAMDTAEQQILSMNYMPGFRHIPETTRAHKASHHWTQIASETRQLKTSTSHLEICQLQSVHQHVHEWSGSKIVSADSQQITIMMMMIITDEERMGVISIMRIMRMMRMMGVMRKMRMMMAMRMMRMMRMMRTMRMMRMMMMIW